VPSAAIATVSMCGYAGLLAGPPLIGAAANTFTLRGGLVLVMLTSAMVVAMARVVGSRRAGEVPGLRTPASEQPGQRARPVAA
jgi:hypothetical protein